MMDDPLLDAIYRVVRTPDAWPAAIEAVCERLGAPTALLAVPKIAAYLSYPIVMHNVDLSRLADGAYIRNVQHSRFADRAIATGKAPGVFMLEELMPPEEQAQNGYFQEVLRPLGVRSVLVTMLTLPDESAAPPVMASFCRTANEPPFTEEDRQKLQALFPHLRRAIRLSFDGPKDEIPRELLDAVSAVEPPILLLGADGRVIFQNAHASELLKTSTVIRVEGSRICFSEQGVQAEFDNAVEAAASRAPLFHWRPRATISVPRTGAIPLLVSLVPLGKDGLQLAPETGPRVLVFVLDGDREMPAHIFDTLRVMFGLTMAEFDIVTDLANGYDAAAIAKRRLTTVATVRTQIKSAMAKAGVSKQSALLTLIARLRAR